MTTPLYCKKILSILSPLNDSILLECGDLTLALHPEDCKVKSDHEYANGVIHCGKCNKQVKVLQEGFNTRDAWGNKIPTLKGRIRTCYDLALSIHNRNDEKKKIPQIVQWIQGGLSNGRLPISYRKFAEIEKAFQEILRIVPQNDQPDAELAALVQQMELLGLGKLLDRDPPIPITFEPKTFPLEKIPVKILEPYCSTQLPLRESLNDSKKCPDTAKTLIALAPFPVVNEMFESSAEQNNTPILLSLAKKIRIDQAEEIIEHFISGYVPKEQTPTYLQIFEALIHAGKFGKHLKIPLLVTAIRNEAHEIKILLLKNFRLEDRDWKRALKIAAENGDPIAVEELWHLAQQSDLKLNSTLSLELFKALSQHENSVLLPTMRRLTHFLSEPSIQSLISATQKENGYAYILIALIQEGKISDEKISVLLLYFAETSQTEVFSKLLNQIDLNDLVLQDVLPKAFFIALQKNDPMLLKETLKWLHSDLSEGELKLISELDIDPSLLNQIKAKWPNLQIADNELDDFLQSFNIATDSGFIDHVTAPRYQEKIIALIKARKLRPMHMKNIMEHAINNDFIDILKTLIDMTNGPIEADNRIWKRIIDFNFAIQIAQSQGKEGIVTLFKNAQRI